MSKRKHKDASQRPDRASGSNGHRNGGVDHAHPGGRTEAIEPRSTQAAPQGVTVPSPTVAPVTAPNVAVPQANLRVGTLIIEPEPLTEVVDAGVPDTLVLPLVSPPQESDGVKSGNRNENGQRNGQDAGHGNGNGTLTGPLDIIFPGASPNGNGTNHEVEIANGNGVAKARVAAPSPVPVKVRVGSSNGHTNGNGGNGRGPVNGNGNVQGGVRKARVANFGRDTMLVAAAGGVTTSHLRAADLNGARYRLKTALPDLPTSPARKRSRRPLPYFLMRHRNMRARTRVGHVRTQASIQRFGKGGAAMVVVKLGLVFFLLSGMVTTAIAGAGIGGVAWFLRQLPPVDEASLSEAIAKNGITVQTSKIYDRNGKLLYEFVDEKTGRREELKLDEISPLVISATIAAEDADFYSNPGIDVRGILRAIQINLSRSGSSGASTITQQLVRQIVLSQEERLKRDGLDGFTRKIKEAILAIQLTQNYSKDLILEMYLNQNPYGHRAYGIGAAARIYFDKDAKDLTLPEAALLAGLPQAPSSYDPIVYPDQAKIRQAYVLDQMAKQGMIAQSEADAAKAQDIALSPYKLDIKAPHFVYYVKDYLEKKYGADFADLGLHIYTTLDLDVQDAAQKVAKDRIEEIRRQRATNAAIVVMKPGTGEILAMVGSVDYNDTSIDGQVNVATAERQPGSSFKPITFATAFKKGWSPGTVLLDSLTQFPTGPGQKPYVPNNYDGRDHGWVTVRESLGNSYNIPAVKALQFAGIQDTLDTAHDMGITGLKRGLDYYGLSLTLGGGEVTLLDMTTAYSTFANGGKAVAANPILEIIDAQGRTLEKIDQNNVPGNQALDPRIAYMVTDILSDNRARTPAFGANSALRLSFPAAAKTGTTDNNRDSWTIGYTPNLTVGVWVGNSNNDEMQRITGAIGAAVIWNKMMETFYDNDAFVNLIKKQNPDGSTQDLETDFEEPDGLIRVSACSNKGGVTDLFLKESRPKGCVNYTDPKVNVRLRGAPSDGPVQRATPRPQQRPPAQPTPRPRPQPTAIPGIMPPIWP